ncbi:hypothetical protein I3760_06G099800 [Carya illinoinensis]|uniref:Uncharacterized protein n=1 Tax=Carya illinoinensis TaxID=32201 RepID=A0A922ERP1_CARIL|nr:hypothetical protein I3760_06G099800 [Carya illinoinensis]KAG6708793.1 hypothetical protein I3842_06G099500 [Carya illinoinensis]
MASLKPQKPAPTQPPAPAIKEPTSTPKTCRGCTAPSTPTTTQKAAPTSKPTPGKKGAGAK